MPSMRPFALSPIALALALASSVAVAQHIPVYPPAVRGGSSGNWFNPAQDGHGLQIEVVDGGRALVTWYTFDSAGRPLWLFGNGETHGGRIEAELYEVTGGRPPAQWEQGQVTSTEWGSVRIEFDNCNAGTLTWSSLDPAFGEGQMPLARLSAIEGTRCNGEEEFGMRLGYSFERGPMDFEPLFADFPVGKEGEWGIASEWTDLADPLYGRKGFRLGGTNHSDDLALFVKSPIRGLRPNTRYRVELEMEIASNAPQGCPGVGGAPGESVAVKLGASAVEPMAVQVADGTVPTWRLNVDFGQQMADGADGFTVGDIATSNACDLGLSGPWHLKTFSTRSRQFYRWTGDDGTLWVAGGIDSGFEGYNEIYVTSFRVRLDPREGER